MIHSIFARIIFIAFFLSIFTFCKFDASQQSKPVKPYSLSITTELIPDGRTNRSGDFINPSKITIHNTGNENAGADAVAHSNMVRFNGAYLSPYTGESRYVSWHYTVDDSLIISQLPINEKAIHAGSIANATSVAIEICMHRGIDQLAANEKAAMLVAYLMDELDLPIESVVNHNYWTGKECPTLLLLEWEAFIAKVEYYQAEFATIDLVVDVSSNSTENMAGARVGYLPLMCWEE